MAVTVKKGKPWTPEIFHTLFKKLALNGRSLSKKENHERLKHSRNIDCVLTNNNEDQTTNHKLLITVTDYS